MAAQKGHEMTCSTLRCRNKAITKSGLCNKCRVRAWVAKNPIRSTYIRLKANSKRRGIEFKLTLFEFSEFCYKTDYIVGKGKRKDSYSIDRIDPNRGYVIDNIDVLTVSENSRKGTTVLIYDYVSGTAYVQKNKPFTQTEHDPF